MAFAFWLGLKINYSHPEGLQSRRILRASGGANCLSTPRQMLREAKHDAGYNWALLSYPGACLGRTLSGSGGVREALDLAIDFLAQIWPDFFIHLEKHLDHIRVELLS